MKLRCLNGTHSALAYLGYLAGHETISDTVADRAFADYRAATCGGPRSSRRCRRRPASTSAPMPRRCFQRYANPAIRHRTWQIAMDGSQKLPQRLLGTIADARAAGRATPGLALAVAAWMRYVGGRDEKGAPIDVRDPLADRLRALSDGATTPEERVAALLGVREIFPAALAGDAGFGTAVTEAYRSLLADGARQAVVRVAG